MRFGIWLLIRDWFFRDNFTVGNLKSLYTILVFLFYGIGLGGVLIEVINPHSFLSPEGASVRVIVLILIIPIWIVFSKKAGKASVNSTTILLFLLVTIYLYAGIVLKCQNFAFENKIDGSRHSCPLMLFR